MNTRKKSSGNCNEITRVEKKRVIMISTIGLIKRAIDVDV